MGRILPALGTNQIAGFVEYRPLTNLDKKKSYYRYLSQVIITIFGLRRVSRNVDYRKVYRIQGTFLAFLHDQVTVQQETVGWET